MPTVSETARQSIDDRGEELKRIIRTKANKIASSAGTDRDRQILQAAIDELESMGIDFIP